MRPWKKHKCEFVKDVGIRHVEIMFESWDGNVAAELEIAVSRVPTSLVQITLLRSAPHSLVPPSWRSSQPESPSAPWGQPSNPQSQVQTCRCHPGPAQAGRGCHSWRIGSAEIRGEVVIASLGLSKRAVALGDAAEGSEQAAERREFYAWLS